MWHEGGKPGRYSGDRDGEMGDGGRRCAWCPKPRRMIPQASFLEVFLERCDGGGFS